MIGLNRILQKGAHLFVSRGLSCCQSTKTLGKVVIPRENTKMLLRSEGYLQKKLSHRKIKNDLYD